MLMSCSSTARHHSDETAVTVRLGCLWGRAKIVPALQIIGDAAAALARPGMNEYVIDHLIRAIGQMQNKGKVMTQEMIQFSEAGVRAWEYLAETLNVDVATAMKMVEDRAVDSSVAIEGILAGMQRDYGGMAEELNKTIEGITTTIRDYGVKSAALSLFPLRPAQRHAYDFAFNTLPKWLQRFRTPGGGGQNRRNTASGT